MNLLIGFSKFLSVITDRKINKRSRWTNCNGGYLGYPWVSSANHLGHELHESGTMEHDAHVKKALFIDKSVEIREMFHFASPVEVLGAMKVFCGSFYGCMLWDLGGNRASQVFNSWTTAVKLSWSVPRATRTYLVQKVLASGLTGAGWTSWQGNL